MNCRKLLAFLGGCYMTLAGCSTQPAVTFRPDTDRPCQTMDCFGASDAWSMQMIGQWPQEKQERIADWLFSTENDASGKPKGIGLSLWRFNVGAGSAEQGDASGIADPWRRAECFLNADGTYDWDKQQGQRRFLRLAKERGVDKFLAFLNSPPVWFTKNGLALNAGRDGTANLKEDCYGRYACFLADVVQGVALHDSIRFGYICPFNEPDGHWNWVASNQEGCPATNREIARTVRLLSDELVRRGMDTQILVSESSDYRCMFRTHETDWRRGYQIQAFFCPDSVDTYLGDTPNVPRLMAGHSYWTTTPLSELRGIRRQLRDTLDKYRTDFWQTETCVMANDEEIGGGHGFDRTMRTALYMARVIHHDIVCAGARSWQWWRSVGGDYKDGLIRAYTSDSCFVDGRVEDSKLMWALGNYSRFIRPGAVRLSVSAFDRSGALIPDGDTDPQGLMCSAYKNVDGTYVMVVINYADESKEFAIDGGKTGDVPWRIYRTSDREGEDLLPAGTVESGKTVQVPARSVSTFQSESRHGVVQRFIDR